MHKSKFPPLVAMLLAVLTILALGAASLHAENVFVTAYKGTTATTDLTPAPHSIYTGASGFGASSASASTGSPIAYSNARRVIYGNTTSASWTVCPTNRAAEYGAFAFTNLSNLGVYKIYVADGESGNASPDILVDMTCLSGGSLADTNGIGSSTVTLDVFQAGAPNDVWIPVGYITNTSYEPVIKFTYKSGTIGSTGGRWYMDAVRFEYLDPCTGVAPAPGIRGPLAAGQTFVNVSGVVAGATNITVFTNNVVAASTNSPDGFAAGTHTVSVPALVKDMLVKATQSKTNSVNGGLCPSDPSANYIVGGGPNPSIKVFLGCWLNSTNQGPIGAYSDAPPNADTTVHPYILKASQMSFGQPPSPGQVLTPGTCWNSVTFQNGVDWDTYLNSGTTHAWNTNSPYFCSLESVIFAIDATDSGPYDIYVDKIMNGTTVVEDFESYADGTQATLVAPNQVALPDPSATYFAGSTNSSLVSTANKFDGTKSCRIQWQWADGNSTRWARVRANSSTGKHYPQLDTRLPITVSYLVLPVGSTVGAVFNGTVSEITNTTPVYQYGSVTMGVTVTGSGSYTYSWEQYDTTSSTWNLLGVTTRTCAIDPLGNTPTARYRVGVTDSSGGGCTVYREIILNLATPLPIIITQPVSAVVNVGSAPSMIWVEATNGPTGGDMIQYYSWEKGDSLTNLAGFTWYCQGSTSNLADAACMTSAQLTDTAYYRCIIQGSYGSVTSSIISLQVVPVGVVIGNGDGLRGNYYNQPNFTAGAVPENWGTVDLSRVDPTVAFDWVLGSPDPAIQAEYFTARWYGQIQPLYTDHYIFTVRSDDGCRLWIDKTNLVINSWIPKGASDVSGVISNLSNTKHDILLEYFEQGGNASVQFFWTNYGGQIAKTFVPKQQLFANMASWTPPAVALTSPANGSTVVLPAQVSLAANVTANDGIVKAVEFYQGTTLITSVAAPGPYTASWSAPAGTYSVTAKVVYNESSKATSSANTVIVDPGAQPVTITSITPTAVQYTGGGGSQFVLLESADVSAALNTWARAQTNTTTPGSFTIAPSAAQQFYRIKSE